MLLNAEMMVEILKARAREVAGGCQKVFVAGSGGIDSSVVAGILCLEFGPENVVVLHRLVRSHPKHLADIKSLQKIFGFKLMVVDLDGIYDVILEKLKYEFEQNALIWVDEGEKGAKESGFENAYASLKSRLTTPLAGFIAKAVDRGRGRIFGTGNAEEDGLLRYYDKYGDGAVDNNILDQNTKAEVRQIGRCIGVPDEIICKTPSADLRGIGDEHNDESELSAWARELGFDIDLSYGAPDGSSEGNIAWALKEDYKFGVITGANKNLDYSTLISMPFDYDHREAKLIQFLRKAEMITRHKSLPPQGGVPRSTLLAKGIVDE